MKLLKIFGFVLVLVIVLQLGFVSAVYNAGVFVIDADTNEGIGGASVTLTIPSIGTSFPLTTGSDGYTEYVVVPYPASLIFKVEASADGYVSGQLINQEFEQFDYTTTFQISLNPGSSSGKYVVNEKLVIAPAECGAGYVQRAEFTDWLSQTVRHCVKSVESFVAGDTYVNNSYLEIDSGIETERCSKGGERFVWFRSSGGTVYLCVETNAVNDLSTEQIVLDSVIAESCPNSDYRSGDLFYLSGGASIKHCAKILNLPQEEPTGGCILSNLRWVDGDRNTITEAVGNEEGRKPGDEVYLGLDVTASCAGESISFEIYEGTDSNWWTTPHAGPFTGEFDYYFFYSQWLPDWFDSSAPGSDTEELIYVFKAKVGDVEKISPSLTVTRPEECPDGDCSDLCQDDEECETDEKPHCYLDAKRCVECFEDVHCAYLGDGAVCSEKLCVAPAGDCALSNPAWLGESGNIYTGDAVRAWDKDNPEMRPGETVKLIVERTQGCLGKDVFFEIYEDDLVFDDLRNVLTRGLKVGIAWEPEWIESFWEGIFEGGSLEYYFIAKVDGEDIQSSKSSLLKVKAPEPRECAEDGQVSNCDSGKVCEKGICVSYVCGFGAPCGGGEVCDDGVCVASSTPPVDGTEPEQDCVREKYPLSFEGKTPNERCKEDLGEEYHCSEEELPACTGFGQIWPWEWGVCNNPGCDETYAGVDLMITCCKGGATVSNESGDSGEEDSGGDSEEEIAALNETAALNKELGDELAGYLKTRERGTAFNLQFRYSSELGKFVLEPEFQTALFEYIEFRNPGMARNVLNNLKENLCSQLNCPTISLGSQQFSFSESAVVSKATGDALKVYFNEPGHDSNMVGLIGDVDATHQVYIFSPGVQSSVLRSLKIVDTGRGLNLIKEMELNLCSKRDEC
ncbi:MAG: hypothetical protein KJ600_00695 [Nanoarchaeota archaeon]|nr:hypothetical protein [Nanoarchaeota archaeon]MBU1103061.1 hypothetical protein [Nanoarchaeota archaeon]